MSHMEKQICLGFWSLVEELGEQRWIPKDHLTDDMREIEFKTGYGARLSAPGYLDCTEWVVFDTEKEVEEYLEEMYGEDS